MTQLHLLQEQVGSEVVLIEHGFTSERYLTNKAGGSMFSPSIRHCSGPKMPGGSSRSTLLVLKENLWFTGLKFGSGTSFLDSSIFTFVGKFHKYILSMSSCLVVLIGDSQTSLDYQYLYLLVSKKYRKCFSKNYLLLFVLGPNSVIFRAYSSLPCLGITSGSVKRLYTVPVIKPVLTICKACVLILYSLK